MAESIQFLIEENKRYRKEYEEMVILLDETKRTVSELQEKLDESSIMNNSMNMSFDQLPITNISNELSSLDNGLLSPIKNTTTTTTTITPVIEDEDYLYYKQHKDEIKQEIERIQNNNKVEPIAIPLSPRQKSSLASSLSPNSKKKLVSFQPVRRYH